MGKLTVSVDTKGSALRLLDGMRNAEKRKAYAIVNAINRVAKEIQGVERRAVEQTLTVRKKEFILRQAAIIKPFASVKKGIMHAQISVGRRPRLLLRQFEQAHERVGQAALRKLGEKGVAVPVIGGARPSKSRVVPEDLWIGKLHLKRPPRPRRAKGARRVVGPGLAPPKPQPLVPRGLQRTYLVPHVGIFQRREGGVRMLWAFLPRVSKAKMFKFGERAMRVAVKLDKYLHEEIGKTIRHALRGRGA